MLPDTMNMPEPTDHDGGYDGEECTRVAVDLKGGGISLSDVPKGVNFEIDPESVIGRDHPGEDGYFSKEDLFKQLNYECLDGGGDSDADDDGCSLSPFERIARRMKDISGDGGVLKQVLHEGTGDVVSPNALCVVHYNAWLEMSDEPFDSSRLRGRKHQVKLGSGRDILGFELGVATMRRGELARFLFAPEYAFGKMGCPPRIPAETTVMFEVEMLSFVGQAALDALESMSEEDRAALSFEAIRKAAGDLRKEGNEAFSAGNVGKACGRYSRALRMLENANLADEEDEEKMKADAQLLYLNLSLCDLKLKRPGAAAKYARKALEREPGNVRAIYRLGLALHQLSEFGNARKHLDRALKLAPSNAEIQSALAKLDKDIQLAKQSEKDLMCRMMKVPVSKPDFKQREKVIPSSQMTELLRGRLKNFKEAPETTEMVLPPGLTEQEMASVKEIAQSLALHLLVKVQDGQTTITVSKC